MYHYTCRTSLLIVIVIVVTGVLRAQERPIALPSLPLPVPRGDVPEYVALALAPADDDQAADSSDHGETLPPIREQEHGGVCAFPKEEAPFLCELIESVPTALSWPDEPLAHLFGTIFHAEHYELESPLEEEAIGLQQIPSRPRLFLEWNEDFLGPGFLNQGIEIPTGAIWRPALWVFGQQRSAIQYFERQRPMDPTTEWANRLDLFGQVNLTGTERILVGLRPLDEERGNRRDFSGYDFRNGNGLDGWNADLQTLFFEGDFGEVFPGLDPFDSRFLDYGFSVGRMPLLAQQGLLINEDMLDAATVTRNTLAGHGNLNLRITGVYGWGNINRNSPTLGRNDYDASSRMVALLTESDFRKSTVNLDAVYVYSEDDQFGDFGDVLVFGASAIQRTYGYHNTYNSSLHVLASFPTNDTTLYAQQGELFFAQTSWTAHHNLDIIYVNAFYAVDQFTSPARGPLQGGALGQTGILFASAGLGRFGAPISNQSNNNAGGSLGYQIFFDETRTQVIWEIGGRKETEGPRNTGTFGTALRYQKAFGQHYIFVLDSFVLKQEGLDLSQGVRTELLYRF